jgi:hypothetical protein
VARAADEGDGIIVASCLVVSPAEIGNVVLSSFSGIFCGCTSPALRDGEEEGTRTASC